MWQFTKHFEKTLEVDATPEAVFNFVDDHERFSSHMNSSSWMMGGGGMTVELDSGRGKRVGSHIRMSGTAFGFPLSLDEEVVEHRSPDLKVWQTVGRPNLLVIGHYRLCVEIAAQGDLGSIVKVSIDYDPPETHRWVGKLFGALYARWCVHQMLGGVHEEFGRTTR
jgi:hypothetical protein